MMPKRLRRHGVKQSKTGCHTCKLRKVKCDEKHPICDKCAKGHRPCNSWPVRTESRAPRFDANRLSVQTDGTPSIPLTPITMNSSPAQTITTLGSTSPWAHYSSPHPPRRSSPVLDDDGLLHRARQIVLNSCIDDFPFFNGILSMTFFQYDVLCQSTKYAAATLEAAAEHITKINPAHRAQVASNTYDLYQKAVSLYYQELYLPNAMRSSTPTTCLFLMCTELLLRRVQDATLHVDAMIGIYGPYWFQRMPSLSADIDCLLRSLDIHKMASSDRAVPNAVKPIQIGNGVLPPADIRALGRHVVEVVHASYCFINNAAASVRLGQPASTFGGQQSLHLNAVSQAYVVVSRLLAQSQVNSETMHLLRLQGICLSVHIELSNLLETSEMSFDSYSQQFEVIITNAERILAYRHSMRQDAGPDFSLQLGLVYPLYLAATKYRHQSWRRKAIDLLGKAGQEGPWRGPLLAAVARRCLEIEEAQTPALNTRSSNAAGYQPDTLAFYQNYLDSHAAQEPSSVPNAGRITACRFVEDSSVAEFAWDSDPAFTNSPVSLTETKVMFVRRREAISALAARTISSDNVIAMQYPENWQTWSECIAF